MSKRAASGQPKGASKSKKSKTHNRRGYSSVPRTRGAAVTGEMKYFDTQLSLSAVSEDNTWANTEVDPATFLTLFVPVVGAGVNQRIGKSAKVLKLKMRFLLSCVAQANQTGADPGTTVRVIVYQDKQTNASQAQGENVMTGGSSDATGILSFQNVDNFGRFIVLMDKTLTLQNPNMSYDGTNVEQAGLEKTFKFTRKFNRPVEVRFNATNGGTIADIVDNSFHVIALCDNDDLAPQISYYSRVCYKE